MGEPGVLQSMGSQRVGHDGAPPLPSTPLIKSTSPTLSLLCLTVLLTQRGEGAPGASRERLQWKDCRERPLCARPSCESSSQPS